MVGSIDAKLYNVFKIELERLSEAVDVRAPLLGRLWREMEEYEFVAGIHVVPWSVGTVTLGESFLKFSDQGRRCILAHELGHQYFEHHTIVSQDGAQLQEYDADIFGAVLTGADNYINMLRDFELLIDRAAYWCTDSLHPPILARVQHVSRVSGRHDFKDLLQTSPHMFVSRRGITTTGALHYE